MKLLIKKIIKFLNKIGFINSEIKKRLYSFFKIVIPHLESIGKVSWNDNDLIQELSSFSKLYDKRPIQNNQGGMKAPQLFPTWFLVNKMRFKYIIESGVWYGQGTWVLEQANKKSIIHSIDPNLHWRKYKSTNVTYWDKDFFEINWDNIVDKNDTLCFFDDHQNAFERVKYAVQNKWKYLVFEDNYPTDFGDCHSLKQIFDNNGKDALFLKKVIKTYYEFPPIMKNKYTRWGDLWDNIDFPTKNPLITDKENCNNKIYLDEIEQYTWICFVELK